MFKFILIFILVIYLLGFVSRWILRRWIQRVTNPEFFQQQQTRQRGKGEVTVDYQPKEEKKIDPSDGEYVDYEDVD